MEGFNSKGLLCTWARGVSLVLVVLGLLLLVPIRAARAQSMNGLISGDVVDPQGASVPGAVVTATNRLTRDKLTTQTNEAGYFVFPETRPGTYNLSVEKAGFETLEKTDIVLLTADLRVAGVMTRGTGLD